MRALFKNINQFGTVAMIGVHHHLEDECDIDRAIEFAIKDNFENIIFYVKYPTNWMNDIDFRVLIETAKRKVESVLTEEERQSEIEEMDRLFVDSCDHFFTDNAHLLDDQDDQVIDNFVSNYSSKSLCEINFDDLDAIELIEKFGRELILKLIYESSEGLATNDHYVQWNEMYSFHVGEHEHQLSDGSFAYGYPCESIILKLDAKLFLQKLNDLKPTRPKKQKPKKQPKAPIISIKKGRSKELTPRQRLIKNQRQLSGIEADIIQLRRA